MVILSNPAAPLEAGDIVDAVWDEAASGHVAGGSIGALVERLDILAAGGAGELTAARAASLANLSNLDAAITGLPTAANVLAAQPRKVTAGGFFVEPDLDMAAVTSGSASAYGAWVQVDASLAADAFLVSIAINDYNGSAGSDMCQVQIGIGGAGSEVVQGTFPVSNLDVAEKRNHGRVMLQWPIAIASGVRIAARIADRVAPTLGHSLQIGLAKAANVEALSA